MNQRNAWIGWSSDGVPDWSDDTTGIGPIVSSGPPSTSPDSSLARIASNASGVGTTSGGAAPNTGHCATTTPTRSSQAATTNTPPAEYESPQMAIRAGS